MIKLIPVSNLLELNEDLKQMYIGSFPPDERREWEDMNTLLQQHNFSLHRVFDEQKLVGLITTWNLSDVLFIEHFVIGESSRGKGIGSQVLKQVIEEKSAKFMVEVEEPTNESARRRIAFYGRLGFLICEGIYYQPPYSPDKSKVKMLLMSFPERIQPPELDKIKSSLYREVYNRTDSDFFSGNINYNSSDLY